MVVSVIMDFFTLLKLFLFSPAVVFETNRDSAFLELATGATGATGAGEVVAGSAARTPHPTRAGGQDDGSYTNSLK